MTTRPLISLSAAALAASIATGNAGPCSSAIDRMQARVDATLDARAAAGPMAKESAAATMHRQPTPESIAAAEEHLGDLSAQRAAAIAQAMERARAADRAGDKNGCEQALAEAEAAIGP
jgi:hypothetical protein